MVNRIYLERGNMYARFVCTSCSHCTSKMGISYGKIKDRGCCSYFPTFDLVDIHKFTKSSEGLEILYNIISNPNTDIFHYYIHAKGTFEKESYEYYIKHNYEDLGIKDKTLFFRTCPFVKSGYGCTLKPEYRHFVCNFFICSEVVDKIVNKETYNKYVREIKRYSRWVEWENQSLQKLLIDHKLSLVNNFDETIKFLQDLPIDIYEFPELDDIYISDDPQSKDKIV